MYRRRFCQRQLFLKIMNILFSHLFNLFHSSGLNHWKPFKRLRPPQRACGVFTTGHKIPLLETDLVPITRPESHRGQLRGLCGDTFMLQGPGWYCGGIVRCCVVSGPATCWPGCLRCTCCQLSGHQHQVARSCADRKRQLGTRYSYRL